MQARHEAKSEIAIPQLRLNKGERTVILAGAGFSKCLGAPLQDELLHRLVTPDGLRIHRIAYGVPDTVTLGIEDFLTVSNFEEAIHGGTGHMSSRELRSKIAVEILYALSHAKVHGAVLRRFYDNFRKLIKVTGAWVTLNWDPIVEAICRADEHPLSYSPYRRSPDALLILKLHGSVDWFKKGVKNDHFPDPNQFTRLFGNYYRFNPFSLVKSIAPDWINTFIRACPPLILAPSHFKSIGDRYISRIWRAAWNEMAFMDHLVVIGYSLPPADIAMRVLLTRMVRRPRKPPELRVSVIDPDATGVVEQRYADLCGDRLEFIKARFEQITIE